MYKYSCYIEDSKEARDGVRLLGVNIKDVSYRSNILIFKRGEIGKCKKNNIKIFREQSFIDCRNNLPLFKALTAVRDDSDIKQWFTDGKVWCLCEENSIKEHLIYTKGDFTDLLDSKFHKATDKELIEKFKKK